MHRLIIVSGLFLWTHCVCAQSSSALQSPDLEDKTILASYFEDVKTRLQSRYQDRYEPGGIHALSTNRDTFLVYTNYIENPFGSYNPEYWLVIKRLSTPDDFAWVLGPDQLDPLMVIEHISMQGNGIYEIGEVPVLWLKRTMGAHSQRGYWNYFYRLEPDSLVQFGFMPGYVQYDNESDEEWLWELREYAQVGEIKQYDDSLLVERKVGWYTGLGSFDFVETYLVTPDTIHVVRSTKPEHYLTREKADSLLQAAFNEYYGDYWKERLKKEGGVRERALTFSHHFGDLSVLRSDYAPAFYNLACMESLAGYTQKAVLNLQRALDLHPRYIDKALSDPDLERVRALPEFESLKSKYIN